MKLRRLAPMVLLLLSGCGAASQPRPTATQLEYGTAGSPASSAPKVRWGVRTFDEKAEWLAAHPALAKTTVDWGEKMAIAVENALNARRVDAQVVPDGVTPEQMEVLFAEGLQYLCEGTLSSVAAADGSGTLRVAYRLKRRVRQDTRTVQARVIEASANVDALDESAMQVLVQAVAEKIADAVVADVPADLLAIRG